MQISKAFKNERLLKSLTGLSVQEFKNLLVSFEILLKEEESKERKLRSTGGGRKSSLESSSEKLFFILFYLKVYPTCDLAGMFFDVDRSQPCRWVKKYLPLLESVLKRCCVLPKRKVRSIQEFQELFPDVTDLFIDGTERRVNRPKSSKNQKRRYSGKKKAHTRKTIVATDDKKKIKILSPMKNGRRHDKKLLDKEEWVESIPPDVTLWVDTGFQGIQKSVNSGTNVMIPKKRYKNKPLSSKEKEENKTISGIRIVVENAIAGIKRFGATTQIYRNRNGQDDKFMLVAAGLWNFHLQLS